MPFKSPHPLYYVWTSMIQRCHTKTHVGYKWYGARGISVCPQWRESFAQFCLDMGERPAGMTLDRRDGNLGYLPSNCEWVSQAAQQRNKSSTKLTKESADQIAKELLSPSPNRAEIARRFGVSRALVRKIANKEVWQ